MILRSEALTRNQRPSSASIRAVYERPSAPHRACAATNEIRPGSYFEELIALIEQTGGLPPEEELRELGIAHGSMPA